jgi:hypothetical protein
MILYKIIHKTISLYKMEQSGNITINNESIKYNIYPIGRYNFIVSYLSDYDNSVFIRLKNIVCFVNEQKFKYEICSWIK